MKKLGILLSVAFAALVFVSCEQSKTIVPAQADELQTITATRSVFPSTKSLLRMETFTYEYDDYSYSYDWYNVLWSAPDKILVGYPGVAPATFKSTNTKPAATAKFKGKLPEPGEEDVLVGVYPAEDGIAINLEPATITLPFHNQQTAVEGSYDPMAFPAIAVSDTKDLSFYNVCGLLQFRLFEEGIDEIVLRPHVPIPGGDIEIDPFGYALRNNASNAGSAVSLRPAERINSNNPKTRYEIEDDYPLEEKYGIYDLEPTIVDAEPIKEISLKAPSGQYLKPGKDYFMSVPPMDFWYDQADIVLLSQADTVKVVTKSGYVGRSAIHPVPISEVYDFSDFAGAWYWYDEERAGYNIVFFEEMPEGSPGELSHDPGGRWLCIDIPAQYINGTYNTTNDFNTGSWNFCIDFYGERCWQFKSRSITVNLDTDAGTVEMSVECESSYGVSVKSSYSGPVEKADSYIWNAYSMYV